MKITAAIAAGLAWFAGQVVAANDDAEFERVRRTAREYYLQQHPGQANSIRSVELDPILGPTANSAQIEFLANASLRLRNGQVARVQLSRKAGVWRAQRELGPDTLAEAHPLLAPDQLTSPYWRESRRLEQRMAQELESRLRREGRLALVEKSYPRCFVALEFNKALCDITYSTWDAEEPECSERATLFNFANGQWNPVKGDYHTGMRIDPRTGKVFEMTPREACAKN